jgi:hypothetical protein
MRFPDFIPAKRQESTDMARAAALQNYGDMQAEQINTANREKMVSGPVDAYKGYVSITDTNPLADAVRNFGKGGGDGTAGGGLNKMGPGSGGRGTTVPHPTGSGLPNTTQAVNQSASAGGGMPGGTANAPTFGMSGQEMLTGGGGNPIALPTSTAVPQMAGEQAASMLAPDAAVQATNSAATQAGTQGATEAAGKGMSPLVGQIGGPVLGAATSGYLESQKPNTSDGKIAIKAGGGAASGSLMAFAPAMAAAGPVGWAGIAGLAALSLYGMLS